MTQLLERPGIPIVVGEEPPPPPPPRRGVWMLAVPGAALLLVAATLVLAGNAGEGPADDQVLVTDGAGTVSLVDTTAGATLYSIEDAVAAPDATTVYRTKPEGEDTQIDQLDARDGSVVGSQVVPGELAIAVVSFDASAVALLPRYSIGYGLYEPVPREVTPITVIRNDGSEPRTYDLEGNFEPETFSKDLDTLFLIEFWPATEPDRYFVRQLDLDSGEMLVTYSPEVEWAPEMRGRARDHTMDPDGNYLYTLYSVQPGDPPIQDREDGTGGDNWAFVHVLDLREEQSICIFLGGDFAERSGDRLGMAIAPDGKTLYVVDSASGAIAEIDTRRHQVSAMIEVPELADAGYYATRPVVEASDDRLFVTQYTSSIWELDRHDNLAAVGVLGTDGSQIIGLDLSPAGNELRIAVPGQIIVYDLIADAEVATVTGPGSGGGNIDFTGAPPGIAGRYPLQCAC